MTISTAFNNALSGLQANNKLAAVTSGNLANALTPSYGRQTVTLVSAVSGGEGSGVRVAGVERALDPELTAARRIADGDLADQTFQFEALRQLERAIGTTSDASSLFNRIGEFESTLRSLAEAPEAPARQEAAALAADELADKFNQLSTETVRLRETTDAEIARRVEQVNTALKKLAQLNRQIQIFDASGRETAALIDERERLVDEVAQNVPIRETRKDSGAVELRTRGGLLLVGMEASELSFTPTPVMEPGLGYSGGAGPLSGLSLRGVDITPGGTNPQRLSGGALSGLFEVRDQIAPEFETQIDSLAADLVARYQDPNVDPTMSPTDPGLFTDRGNRLQNADIVGLAGRLALNAAVDPTTGEPERLRDGLFATAPRPAADATIPQNFRDALLDQVDASAPPVTPGVSGSLTLAQRAAAVTELIATARVTAEAESTTLAVTREALALEESNELSVDSDVELSRLIEIEQAYSANAQVIQIASRMLEELTRIR